MLTNIKKLVVIKRNKIVSCVELVKLHQDHDQPMQNQSHPQAVRLNL